jgi:tRNA (guanine37-N1)-methyltransferase
MKTKLQVTFLTIFPEMFPGPLGFSLCAKALEKQIWSYNVVNIRDFGITKHKKVDDQPCGGGAGMVIRPDVLASALDFALNKYRANKIFYMSPRGMPLKQERIQVMLDQTLKENNIIIICGRFEGIDQRIITYYNVEEISIGDYIISGGELAAMILVDWLVRTLDGVVSSNKSIVNDSFSMSGSLKGLLEYPLYTKPADWRGMNVPEVLLSGNHQGIEDWKIEKAREVTKKCRPDLWQAYEKVNNN